MAAREIITLQAGHYSNFVGAHWWNIQESSFVYDPKIAAEFPKEVNHDVLFREGQTLKGETTFTPRLVLFDLNHSLRTLKQEGFLYEAAGEDDVKWPGDVTLHQTQRAEKNNFLRDLEEGDGDDDGTSQNDESTDALNGKEKPETEMIEITQKGVNSQKDKGLYNLDSDVQVWSDYLRTGFHPKTIHLLQEFQHNNQEQKFDVFGLGQRICDDNNEWDRIEDRIRYFTEECDQLKGFQILFDNHNAFGGLSSSILSYLSDEYPTKARFTFALTPACPPDQTPYERAGRILNSALSLHYCGELSSLMVPLSLASSLWRNVGLPVNMANLEYKADLDYHTSAVLAASIDTLTMPYRRESLAAAGISDITTSFSSSGRKIAAVSASFPFPLSTSGTFADCLMGHGHSDPWYSLTPHVVCQSSPYFQSCVVRGIPPTMAKRQTYPGGGPRLLSACKSVDEVLQLYLGETYPNSMNAGCCMRDGVSVVDPFPHIFSRNVSHKGLISETHRPDFTGVESVPAMTSLQSSPDVHSHVSSLHECVSKFNISRHPHFLSAGLESDEFTEILCGLDSLAGCYKNE